MKFSEAWLRTWVDPPISREALFEQLTMAGLEVEVSEPVAEEFTGVVVAKVVSVAQHPNADKLSVCQVDDGETTHQVVCGAPNVRDGLVSAFARIGALLPQNFKIKKAKLRDVESHGMLCSLAELGLGDDADGIIELPADSEIGVDLRSALALDDVSIDLDLTPNRGDCLSIRGLAREVGVLNSLAVSPVFPEPVPASIDDVFPVELAEPAGCPRYLGRVIRNIDISQPTPLWLSERLRRSGVRSIDPVVDVTNYVMIELGQPMHAFDLAQINDKIVVRLAQEGETLTLLDGQEVALDAETLLITDAAGPVAIAGVMGGERSGVQANTKDVFLECAFFAPMPISGTARRYGLHTDASQRYERGVDFELQASAMERATALLLEVAGGQAGPVVEAVEENALPTAATVSLRQRRLNELLGVDIDVADVDQAIQRLDFELTERRTSESDGVCWTIKAPSHRFDIAIEADLVEEVCRIYGYNNIPSRMPASDLPLRNVPLETSPETSLKHQLAALGYQESITYSFVDPKLQDLLAPGVNPLALVNPMSSDLSVMRSNLLPGLTDVLRNNISRQQDRARLFEMGLCFVPGDVVVQEQVLGGLLWGRRHPERWVHTDEDADFFDIKGDVERLFEWSGEKAVFKPVADPVLHPGQSAQIVVAGETVGRLGRLHPEVERRLDLGEGIFIFEISATALLNRRRRQHRELSRYPSVRRDLALVVDQSVSAGRIADIVQQTLGDVLVDFRLFDLYQGKGIDSNEKSLAVGLTLQHPSATLTEEEIGHYTHQVISALERDVGARLR
ncbi:MAG: phenylalanine--tRNA ligase subunit beta [Gammaproteobacteria bacterium]|nr:phenylalanine--tRNA ligase subunit beta [Gammaproteobacteria bacterium]